MKKILFITAFLGAVTFANAQQSMPVIPKFSTESIQITMQSYTHHVQQLIDAYTAKDQKKLDLLMTKEEAWGSKLKREMMKVTEKEFAEMDAYLRDLSVELNKAAALGNRSK